MGAFIANQTLMRTLTYEPVLGHITTFGGHPVSCAAGKAAFEVLLEGGFIASVRNREKQLCELLVHPSIVSRKSAGLWMSLGFISPEYNQAVIHQCIKNGLITDWFLFSPDRLRIAPPLICTEEDIREICHILIKSMDEVAERFPEIAQQV